jgi:hypothetical protein
MEIVIRIIKSRKNMLNTKLLIITIGMLLGFISPAVYGQSSSYPPVCFETNTIYDPPVQLCTVVLYQTEDGYYVPDPSSCFSPAIWTESPTSPTYTNIPPGQLIYICTKPRSILGTPARCSLQGGPPSQLLIINASGYYLLSTSGSVTPYKGGYEENSRPCPSN